MLPLFRFSFDCLIVFIFFCFPLFRLVRFLTLVRVSPFQRVLFAGVCNLCSLYVRSRISTVAGCATCWLVERTEQLAHPSTSPAVLVSVPIFHPRSIKFKLCGRELREIYIASAFKRLYGAMQCYANVLGANIHKTASKPDVLQEIKKSKEKRKYNINETKTDMKTRTPGENDNATNRFGNILSTYVHAASVGRRSRGSGGMFFFGTQFSETQVRFNKYGRYPTMF